MNKLLWAFIGFAIFIVGCSPEIRHPDLANLYNGYAQHEDPWRNPIIVIPGLMGSRLVEQQSGKLVWGAFGLNQIDPNTVEGAPLVALPMSPDPGSDHLVNTVQPDGALDRVVINFLGFPMELNAYYNILRALGVGGYRDQGLGEAGAIDYGDQHYTCFQFDYDWRLNIVESAKALEKFIQEKTRYVREETKRRYGIDRKTIRFDIVAHSMGGLVARYFLRYGSADLPPDGNTPEPTWAGAPYIENFIMIGTPNGGSLDSLQNLIEGYRPSFLYSKYSPAVIGTFPSLYQMLPRERHHPLLKTSGQETADPFDVEIWQRNGWGLADPKEASNLEKILPSIKDPDERRQIALAYLSRVLNQAKQFTKAMDVPAKSPEDVHLFLVAGDAVSTKKTARINPNGSLEIVEFGPGDWVVLRRSALLDERQDLTAFDRLISPINWSQTLFLFSDHLGLTKDPVFIDNILHFLLERPRKELVKIDQTIVP